MLVFLWQCMLHFVSCRLRPYLPDSRPRATQLPARFPGQAQYEHGSCMCTTASFFWLLAVIRFELAASPPHEAMHKLMSHAAAVHHDVVRSLHTAHKLPKCTKFLNHEDIITASRLPSGVASTPMAGHQLDCEPDPDFATLGPTLHRRDLYKQVGPSDGLLLTANNHTVAFCADRDGCRHFFDSMPAVVLPVHHPRELDALLDRHLGPFAEFDCTLFRVSRP